MVRQVVNGHRRSVLLGACPVGGGNGSRVGVATHHPNHLLAAVRFLLLGGLDHPLVDAYATGDIDRAVVQFRAFLFDHRDAILDVLAHPHGRWLDWCV